MEADSADDEATVKSRGLCTHASVALDYSAHFTAPSSAFRAEFFN